MKNAKTYIIVTVNFCDMNIYNIVDQYFKGKSAAEYGERYEIVKIFKDASIKYTTTFILLIFFKKKTHLYYFNLQKTTVINV